ncbi:MAG: hypothetical protein F4X16_09155, partial [Caldilineaceae bacterium SB0661_bin_34]|nr:hypothetical protein [Caldilineaceae bacterium SB0661_bin_34]
MGVPVAGVLPFLPDVRIPEEDGVGLPADGLGNTQAVLDIAVMRLPHIANFDEFDSDYEFDRLAVHVRRHLDMDLVYRMMENRRSAPGPAHVDRLESYTNPLYFRYLTCGWLGR